MLFSHNPHRREVLEAGPLPRGICAGPDGNIWFTEQRANRIGMITPLGQITFFNIPAQGTGPYVITAGADGYLWFTGFDNCTINRISTAGLITQFVVPSGEFQGIAIGPDGNMWFAGDFEVNRFVPSSGAVDIFDVPTDTDAGAITAGPDGNLYTCPFLGRIILQISPDGTFGQFVSKSSLQEGITTGPDGNLWYVATGGAQLDQVRIGRLRPTPRALPDDVVEFAAPTGPSAAVGIAAGPDGNVWFTEVRFRRDSAGFLQPLPEGAIGRITTEGVMSQFLLPTGASGPSQITAGADGNIWFTEADNDQIGRITPDGVVTMFPLRGGGGGFSSAVARRPELLRKREAERKIRPV